MAWVGHCRPHNTIYMKLSIGMYDISVTITMPDGIEVHDAVKYCTNALIMSGYAKESIMGAMREILDEHDRLLPEPPHRTPDHD